MTPGPSVLGTNRFALLSENPTKKRKAGAKSATSEVFPSLPTVELNDPKYVVVSATDNGKPLSEYSCFAVHKCLKVICKDILSVNQLRDGSLLLLIKNANAALKLTAVKQLPGICEISINFHSSLNFSKGTIYAPFLKNVPENEIVDELKSFGVIDAYKFKKNFDGNLQPSGVVLLTFDKYNLPTQIDIAWMKAKIRPYIPNPMRCKNCQLLGHTSKRCKRSPACVKCNLPPHEGKECTRILCANCFGEHLASSNDCPRYKQSKEILKIKTTNKCTMLDAVKQYKQLNPTPVMPSSTSYSSVAGSATSPIASSTPSKTNTTVSKINTNISSPITNNNNLPSTSAGATSMINPTPKPVSPSTNSTTVPSIAPNSPDISLINTKNKNLFTPLPSLPKVISLSQAHDLLSDDEPPS